MIKNKNIFYEEELDKLPLTYRKMDKMKTSEVRELVHLQYSKSDKHFNNFYPVTISDKPYSNYVLDNGN